MNKIIALAVATFAIQAHAVRVNNCPTEMTVKLDNFRVFDEDSPYEDAKIVSDYILVNQAQGILLDGLKFDVSPRSGVCDYKSDDEKITARLYTRRGRDYFTANLALEQNIYLSVVTTVIAYGESSLELSRTAGLYFKTFDSDGYPVGGKVGNAGLVETR